MKKILANRKRWHGKRKRKTIKGIVIHYTGNKGDTAKNNCDYFKNPPSLTKKSSIGAHFFISPNGETIKSIPMNQIAYAVGGARQSAKGGRYYKRLTNENTVSIELCNAVNGYTGAQVKAVRKTIKYIRRYCKNAKIVCYHFDVNGKSCPPWGGKRLGKEFLAEIGE